MAVRIIVDTHEEKEALINESQRAWDYADDPDMIPEDNITARLHLNPDMIEVIGEQPPLKR